MSKYCKKVNKNEQKLLTTAFIWEKNLLAKVVGKNSEQNLWINGEQNIGLRIKVIT